MGRVSPQAPIKSRLGRPSGAPGKPTSQRNDTQSIVAGVRPSKCPYILTVVAIALAIHREDKPMLVEQQRCPPIRRRVRVADGATRRAGLSQWRQGSVGKGGSGGPLHRKTHYGERTILLLA